MSFSPHRYAYVSVDGHCARYVGSDAAGDSEPVSEADVLRRRLAIALRRAENAEARVDAIVHRGLAAISDADLRAELARRQIPLDGARGGGSEATRSGAPVSPPAREPSSPPEPEAVVGLEGVL